MKKLKTVAVVCGAVASVGVAAPAFAEPAPPAGGVRLPAQVVEGAATMIDPITGETFNPTGTAYGKLDDWIAERDSKMREAVVGLSDSQTLGLNAFRSGR